MDFRSTAQNGIFSESDRWPQISYTQVLNAHVLSTPEKTAVVGNDGVLSYKQLESLSRLWADRLLDAGIGKGDTVAVCVERSHELPALLLGVLMSGACYVPVDPGFPADRIAIIINDSNASAAITDAVNHSLFSKEVDIPVLLVEELPRVLSGHTLPPWNPEDLAYLMFTSGSTGRPKGVPITRAAMMNFLAAMLDEPGLTANDRVLAITTISFDISVLELFLPLIAGATVYIARREEGLDPEQLSSFIGKHRLTFLQATPATWKLLYDYGWRPQNTQKLLCGGEAFPVDLAENLISTAGEVWNMYGPTEATVWSSCHRITEADVASGNIPLGNPLPNLAYRVCDTDGNLCAPDEQGELWIGGVAVSPGYILRPELNSKRFVVKREAGKQTRFYQTGDLVCLKSDGSLLYKDRLDSQVKIRGYRIELGEIETALRSIPGVQDAVVITNGASGDNAGLVGCIRPDSAPDELVLSTSLAATLPDYMIPRVWFRVNQFPETPNRKVDRKKLSEVVRSNLMEQAGQNEELPGEMAALARFWGRILGQPPASSDANFLSLGGHSLSAARLSLIIEENYKCWIEPVKFIASPTLAEHWELVQSCAPSLKPKPQGSGHSYKGVKMLPDLIPASSTQLSMWYAETLSDSQNIYNESEAFRVGGGLSQTLLKKTLKVLQERHIAFRMVPEIADHNLVGWRLSSDGEIPLKIELLDDNSPDVSDLMQKEARTPFDFESLTPLIRFALHHSPSGDDYIQFTAHHMIIDGLSEQQLWCEFVRIYTAFESEIISEMDGTQDDFFAHNLCNAIEHDEADISYWRSVFQSPAPTLEIRTDHPRSSRVSYEAIQAELTLGGEDYNRFHEIVLSLGVTPFQFLLSVYFIWLDKYAQQGEYVVGVPVSGRHSGLAAKAIGLFINTVPVREVILPDEPFSDFALRLKATTIDAFKHGKLPLDALVKNVNPPREVGRMPLYQALFTLNDQHEVPGNKPHTKHWQRLSVDTGYAPAEIVLFADIDEESIRFRLQGNEGLFEQKTLNRMIVHFRNLLESALADPYCCAHNLKVMDEDEKNLIEDANTTYHQYPRNENIVSCFRSQVAHDGSRIAIEFGGDMWSYSELASHADRVCQVLLEKGVREGDAVGVVASRHPDTVAALIGILQAGATYVPLDLSYPPQRTEHMILQSGIQLILAHNSIENKSGSFPGGCEVVQTDTQPTSDPMRGSVPVMPLDRAYIMFTSGSTGVPKGIEISHRNVLRLVKNTNFMDLNSETRFLMNSPVPFDASTLEIWGPLLNGGTLVVPDVERLTSADMERVLKQNSVNCVFLTTTLLHFYADEAARVFSPLKYLLTGGEVLSPHFAKKILSQNPHLQLINGYGPTENTTFTCCFSMSDQAAVPTPVPIGKPVANTRVYILDSQGHQSPVGVPGELYAAGDGVALGYLNQPELTKKVFLNTQLDKQGRLYRTGDLARWREDGNIEFLGRVDNQVKIRGFRIEPDEVTQKVLASGTADHAYTTPWQAPSGEVLLVCYFVPANSFSPEKNSLKIRELLSESLPSYMVPAHIIQIDKLPTGPTGKVDRSKLPEPGANLPESGFIYPVKFENEIERKLANIWEEVLGRSDFGRTDDFFQLGGSSLKALQVFSRIEKQFGLDLPLASLLNNTTVTALSAELAGRLHALQAERTAGIDDWSSLVVLAAKKSKISPIVCVHAVGGNVLSYRGLLAFQDIERPIVGFQSRSLDGKTEPPGSIEEMAQSYVNELLAAGYTGRFSLMGGSMGGNIALAMAQAFANRGVEVDWVILLDTIGPKARHLLDHEKNVSLLLRAFHSITARTTYYGKALLVWAFRRIRNEVPYKLRPFWVEEAHKAALFRHADRVYEGNVLLIRAPEHRGDVYAVPSLGWEGVLTGTVLTKYVDVKHEWFMESDIVHDLLHKFFLKEESEAVGQGSDDA